MKNEEIAIKKHTNMAANYNDPDLKSVFSDLAAMESGHKQMMEKQFVDIAISRSLVEGGNNTFKIA